jgi:hypothetical protein
MSAERESGEGAVQPSRRDARRSSFSRLAVVLAGSCELYRLESEMVVTASSRSRGCPSTFHSMRLYPRLLQ